MKNKKDLKYYLTLPWTYLFEWSEIDNCYIVSILELKGCISHGDTLEEAKTMINDALKSYISCCLQYDDVIPEPLKLRDYKGNIAFRTSSEIHYQLAQKTKTIGISINSFIEEAIKEKLNRSK